MKLVIVESPTKAKTISKFLGKAYRLESSFGHVRDLPKSKLGVDVEHDFTPHYIVPRSNQKRVTALKKLAAKADHIYFATDEDREGEAISWHLLTLLGVPQEKAERIVFHEITEEAITKALEHPRSIDQNLVDAQQARRILDRLVGYGLSPLLWRKVAKGLSAGRVQSVALRIIVEREREILAFVPQEYWTIEISVSKDTTPDERFVARLAGIDGNTLEKFAVKDKEAADAILSALSSARYTVKDVLVKEVKKSAPTPFITSSLQQDANRRLHFSPKQTMMIAQQLYEGIEQDKQSGGYITYMRTDSVNLSERFLSEAHTFIQSAYGEQYTHGPRRYSTKSKLAQEAHEAIRPTSVERAPESVRDFLTDQQFKLYDLIWRRAVGSQMNDALFEATTIDINADKEGSLQHQFRATGQRQRFDGFTRVYGIESEEVLLPLVQTDDPLTLHELSPLQHFTKPPARYSEAGLVKALEEHGIGRPSTYAPTISTIIERNYCMKEERRLKPTEIGILVNDLLVEHFPAIVDFNFTARMEDDLDKIAEGQQAFVPVLREFYGPFKENLDKKEVELKKQVNEAEPTGEVCEKCGKPMVIKFSRYGKFIACTGFPDCRNSKSLPDANDSGGSNDPDKPPVEPCEKCGSQMVEKRGRFGKFLGCSKYPDCKNIRSLTDRKLGMKCPDCGEGEVIQKRSKRGKTFYSCNRYPDCKYVAWTRPDIASAQGVAAVEVKSED
ncbi:type I DNA topoisomerase [Candidatus Uhrbacteria bacterium]|nr:type I DNA topoisomerase [Candidatus Uhrbacteria bacterium]